MFVPSGLVFFLFTGYIAPSGSRTFIPVNATNPENGPAIMPLVVSPHENLRSPNSVTFRNTILSLCKTHFIVSTEVEAGEGKRDEGCS